MKRLEEDKYIGYNEYKNWCEENNIQIDENTLNERNNKFIQKN